MSQIPVDCWNEIFEYLEDDTHTLYSCILVNHFWCEVSVRILWRNVWNYPTSNFSTLIACLPIESKEILSKNDITILTPTLKPPTFNYASFCKVLSVNRVRYKIEELLNNQQAIPTQNLKKYTLIVVQEIFQMFLKEISSLRSLAFYSYPNITFDLYPGAKDCLKNLTELCCNSKLPSEFFYQLSQICCNIQSFTVSFEEKVSDGLVDLISTQKNLKFFGIRISYYLTSNDLNNIVFSLMTKLPNTLVKINLHGGEQCIPLSFIANFSNLQELKLTFYRDICFVDFEKLLHVNFLQLQVLKIRDAFPKDGLLIKFLENNGNNLKEIYIGDYDGKSDNSLNLVIAKFCPMLRKLSIGIKNNELETLELIFNNCKYLESIKIWCGDEFLSEKQALETVVKFSQNINELILYHLFTVQFKLLPEELESFFISWTDRNPQKSLSLVISKYDANSLDTNDENIEIINKYINLGIIKKFNITDFDGVLFKKFI